MARIHTHHKGRSGSVPPIREKAPEWQALSGKDVEQQVITLAKDGKTNSMIGLYLRDQFGVPDVRLATGKSISAILAENNLTPKLPEDIAVLLRRVVNMQEHLPTNPKDLKNKRALELIESKIRRLAKYYRREGRLPETWTYSTETARLLLE
jgi:small subunit ribosomal protein S15